MDDFPDKLIAAISRKRSAAVVGLDPDIALMPPWFVSSCESEADALWQYGRFVIDAVHDLVPVVKPQLAYYEVHGSAGMAALASTIAYARDAGLLVLLDAKRGDIGSTSGAYARAYLDGRSSGLRGHAITLSPYLGGDSLAPFVDVAREVGAGLFVCAMTSNPGARDLQCRVADGKPIHQHVADLVRNFQEEVPQDAYSRVGIVAGATYPAQAAELRQALPKSFFLVPGMGHQGGDSSALAAYFDAQGLGAIVSSSRAILYPQDSTSDHESLHIAIREAAMNFRDTVNRARGIA